MTERERLIELIEEWYKNAPTQYLADYLLENGVIVPPCKVGEKVSRSTKLVNGESFVQEGIIFTDFGKQYSSPKKKQNRH